MLIYAIESLCVTQRNESEIMCVLFFTYIIDKAYCNVLQWLWNQTQARNGWIRNLMDI